MPQIEALSESQIIFKSRSEIVGWANIGGSSRPISGIVVGRELLGVDKNSESLKFGVETYVKITGNRHPLLLIPNSRFYNGITGDEVVITESLSPDFALKLAYTAWPIDISEVQQATQLNKGEEALTNRSIFQKA